jgi:hypothetical protein
MLTTSQPPTSKRLIDTKADMASKPEKSIIITDAEAYRSGLLPLGDNIKPERGSSPWRVCKSINPVEMQAEVAIMRIAKDRAGKLLRDVWVLHQSVPI